jgi:hypothetical protein
MDDLLDRSVVAEAAFTKYIQERSGDYYLADTDRWCVRPVGVYTQERVGTFYNPTVEVCLTSDVWSRKYWLGSRTSMNRSERTFFIEFVAGTNTISKQWQE